MSKNYMPPLLSPNSSKWVLVSVLFSLFYFLPLFFAFDKFSSWKLAVIFVAYAMFLGLYYWGLRVDSNRVLLPVLFILTLSFGVTFISPGSNSLFCFAAFLAGYYFSLKRAIVVLVLTELAVISAFLSSSHSAIYIGMASLLSAGHFFTAILVRKDVLHRFSKERDQRHIQQLAAIAERERISRDLHDLLGHSLSGIALKAELAEKYIQANKFDLAAEEVSMVADLARSTLSEVRESVSGLKQKGLDSELGKMCQQLQSAGFQTECEDAVSGREDLSAEVESTIILLLKEACTNILRHSNGNRARITLQKDLDAYQIKVWDNGSSSPLVAGNGMGGMEERCQELGGRLTLSSDESGTLLGMMILDHHKV